MMSFPKSRVAKDLDAALAKAADQGESSHPELTNEEAGLLYGFVHSKQAAGRLTPSEESLVERVEAVLNRWRTELRDDGKHGSPAHQPCGQDLCRGAISKLRMRRFGALDSRDVELVRGVLAGCRACRHRGPLVSMIRTGLGDYERFRSQEERKKHPADGASFLLVGLFIVPVLAMLLSVGAYKFFIGVGEVSASVSRGPAHAQTVVRGPRQVPRRLSPEEKFDRRIREYEARLADAPEAREAPALRFALGNLQAQKHKNYAEAARQYELLLFDYPDWPNISQVYSQLERCYEKMGDLSSQELLYKEMMERFPRDSREYQYARSQLGY